MSQQLLSNAIRFFSKGQKCLLTFLRILKKVMQEENINLNCLSQLEMDVEMAAAPPGCDFPDAPWMPKLQEFDDVICGSESLGTLSPAILQRQLKKSFEILKNEYPELGLEPQHLGSLLQPTLLKDLSMSTLLTTADMEEARASVLSSPSTECPPKTLTSPQPSYPLLGVKRGQICDQSTEPKSKMPKTHILPIFSSKYL